MASHARRTSPVAGTPKLAGSERFDRQAQSSVPAYTTGPTVIYVCGGCSVLKKRQAMALPANARHF